MARNTPTPIKDTSPGTEEAPAWKFEIVDENFDPEANPWSGLQRAFAPLLEAGRTAIEDVYASLAQIVLEKKEEFEDWRAERRARELAAARAARATKPTSKAHLEVVVGRKSRAVSNPSPRS
jgi:hypothetical protein